MCFSPPTGIGDISQCTRVLRSKLGGSWHRLMADDDVWVLCERRVCMGVMPRVGNTSVCVRIPGTPTFGCIYFLVLHRMTAGPHPGNPASIDFMLQIGRRLDGTGTRLTLDTRLLGMYMWFISAVLRMTLPFCLRLLNRSSVTRLSSCVLASISP
jgi:hypothetical protein